MSIRYIQSNFDLSKSTFRLILCDSIISVSGCTAVVAGSAVLAWGVHTPIVCGVYVLSIHIQHLYGAVLNMVIAIIRSAIVSIRQPYWFLQRVTSES